MPLGPTEPTCTAADFIRSAPRASLPLTALHRLLCGLPVDDFDVNAWLGIYPLHLFTNFQISQFLAAAKVPMPLPRILDIGTGEGNVTKELRPCCQEMVACETSSGMAHRLQRLGYTVWCEDVAYTASKRAASGDGGFSLVSALNVLDRCAAPKQLLDAAHLLLKSQPAWLLLATPLPFRGAYYGWKTMWSGSPVEALEFSGGKENNCDEEESWATQAEELVEKHLPAAGFEVTAVSRLPYLCGGDAFTPFRELDDIIVLARKV